jgi:hypothetical protein
MDFFLWGHIKALIYMSPVDSEEDLIARMAEEAASIRQQPSVFEPKSQSLLRRCRLCVEVAVRLNICSKLGRYIAFLKIRILQ